MDTNSITVLLVEDDKDDYRLTSELLSEIYGARVAIDWVANYDVALDKIKGKHYDVYLLDYRLGEHSGLDLLKDAVALAIREPIILLTGQGSREIGREAVRIGAADYLIKGNLDAPLLERAIDYAIQRNEIQQTLQRQALTFDTIHDVIFFTDLQGRIVDWNPAAEKITGYSRDEALGKTSALLHRPEESGAIIAAIAEGLQREGRWTGEMAYVRKDGTEGVVETIVALMFNERGQPTGTLSTNRDITDRKRAEEALSESEERHRAILEQVSEAIFLIDPNTKRFVVANPAFRSLVGYTADELLDMTIYDVLPYERERIDSAILRALNEGDYQVSDRLYRRKDGSLVIVEVGITPVIYSGRKVLCQIVRDITERKQAEEALATSEAELRALFAAMTDVVLVLDAQGRYLQIAPTNPDLLYKPTAELLGRTVHEMLPTTDADNILHHIRLALEKQQPVHVEYSLSIGDVEVWFDGTVSPMGEDKVFWIARDVTERKQAEESLHLSSEILQRVKSLVLVSDIEGQITYASPSVKTLLGYEPQEMLGDGWWHHSSFDLEDGKRERSHIVDLAVPETVVPWEPYERMVKDQAGELHWILWQDVKGPGDQVIGVGHDITERKEVEESLRESEERFRLMFASNPLPMWVYEVESLRFLEVNDAAVVRYGYSREEFLAMRITDIRPSEEKPRLRENLAQARPALQSSGEWRHQTKAGQIIDMQITSHTFAFSGHKGSKGAMKQSAVLVVAEDITERKLVAEELQKREMQLSEAQEIAHVGSWEADVTTGEAIWSDELYLIYGVEAQSHQATFERFMECVHPDDRGFVGKGIEQAYAKGGSFEFDHRVLRPDGSVRVVSTRGKVVLDENGRPSRVVGTAQDVTERNQSERALKESEQRYKQMFEGNGAIQWLIDPTTASIVEANQAASDFYGYSLEALKGMNLVAMNTFFGEVEGKELLERMSREAVIIVARHTIASGKIKDVEVRAGPIDLGGRRLIHSIITDISEQKRAEGARMAQEAAEQANRAKSEFLSRMSHELRTPLNAIIGFSQLLEMDDLDPDQMESVGLVHKAGRHLLDLINEMLDISRIEAGHMSLSTEPISVAELLRECLDLVKPIAADKNIMLMAGKALEYNSHVQADRQRLKQIILNLLSNAVKYNRVGGSVWLSCEELVPGRMRIAINDTGAGIAQEKLEKLFTPFERLDADQTGVEGTGLGLALSKRLAELMGGDTGVESVVGQGSRFWVELPAAASPLEQVEVETISPLHLPEIYRTGRTVLYIEDNSSNLRLIEHIFKQWPDIKLLSAMQGSLGFELACKHDPDLILLDLHLPDVHGERVLEWLRQDPRTKTTPVVIISADATPREAVRLLDLGANSYITKPINVKHFVTVIMDALEERELTNVG
jgi:PAS domain S-box-containing protein